MKVYHTLKSFSTLNMPNCNFIFSVLRSVGFDGLVTSHWRLNSVSGIDNSNITFNVTSGTVSFSPNNAMQNIFFQVSIQRLYVLSKCHRFNLYTCHMFQKVTFFFDGYAKDIQKLYVSE